MFLVPKSGIFLEQLSGILTGSIDKPGWALCIGAGTSVPIFPDWYTLAAEMADCLFEDKEFNAEEIKRLGFSPDAMIQMVKNLSCVDDAEFTKQMSTILYSKFRSKVLPEDWKTVAEVLGANNISNCSVKKWKLFSQYRDSLLQNTSAYQIAPIILEAIEHSNGPQTILSFNAEPLLLSILNSLLVDGRNQFPKKVFSKVINSVSNHSTNTIPYVFCHGLLPVYENARIFSTSADKLVFLEEEYLHLANNSFSWQSASFLHTCVSQHIVFIGTSLTDPNMRRWLSWTHANRLEEMEQNGLAVRDSTQHYWIRTVPSDREIIPWIEAAVAHLGVRIIWIDNWNQVGLALKKMLGLYKTPSCQAKVKARLKKKSKKYHTTGGKSSQSHKNSI